MSKRKNYQYYETNVFGYYGFGPVPSEPQPSRYAFINKLLKIEEEEKRIVFYFLIGKEQQKFYLEFPIMGGFRFYGDCSGFFRPQSLLEPNKTEDGYLTADGYKLNICDDEDEWYIALCSKSGELVRFDRKTFRFGYCKELPEKIKITLPLDGDERLTGCGERFSGLDQTGKRHQFWNCDCGYHGKSEFLELWKSYKNIPLLHSTKGYSLFLVLSIRLTAIWASATSPFGIGNSGDRHLTYMSGAETQRRLLNILTLPVNPFCRLSGRLNICRAAETDFGTGQTGDRGISRKNILLY